MKSKVVGEGHQLWIVLKGASNYIQYILELHLLFNKIVPMLLQLQYMYKVALDGLVYTRWY